MYKQVVEATSACWARDRDVRDAERVVYEGHNTRKLATQRVRRYPPMKRGGPTLWRHGTQGFDMCDMWVDALIKAATF